MNKNTKDCSPDYLRTPDTVCLPDSRSPKTDWYTRQPLTIDYQYGVVSEMCLHDGVPEDICIQFETTKNIYLYAWFVYRFYPVSELHAYTCLEFALRERFEVELLAAEARKRKWQPGLKELLSYAATKGYLKDENFSVWQHRTRMRAQQRTEMELWQEAERRGVNQITIDESQYEIKDVDREHEYIPVLIKTMPWLRNMHAHGSQHLDNQSASTISLVAEIINQVFPRVTGEAEANETAERK